MINKVNNNTAWLIYNTTLQTQKFLDVYDLYLEAGEQLGINIKLIKNSDINIIINNLGETSININLEQEPPLFIIFLDKDLYLARHLELLGYKVFNSSKVIEDCDDKLRTMQILANKNICMPETIFFQFCYNNNNINDKDFLKILEQRLGFPMVIKEAVGSFGKRVYLVKDMQELINLREKILITPHLYQKMITTSIGRDVRIHVVGNEVIASVLRTNPNDFRANVTNGGTMQKYKPPKEFLDMAIKVNQILGATFTGVDIMFGEDDKPVLCEINSNAHIKNIYDITGKNVAYDIIKHIKTCINLK